MKLPYPTVRKLFREDFSQSSGIVIDRSKFSAEAKRWRKQLTVVEGIYLTQHPGDKDPRSRTLSRFTIPEPNKNERYYRSQELRLECDEMGILQLRSCQLRHDDLTAKISDWDEVKGFVQHVLQRYANREAGEKKRSKVREFKTRAIMAQVKKIARDQDFEFATLTDSVKLRLFIRLASHEMMEIVVPFTRFEVVLPKLKQTIHQLRELYAEGLRFKVAPATRLPRTANWQR